MRVALEQALLARVADEVPVGAAIVLDRKVVSTGFNCPITRSDPTAHAEIVALRAAAQAIGNYRLVGATLYVTVAPCLMCFGAMVHARIARLVFGARNPESARVTFGEPDWANFNHRFEISAGVLANECSDMIVDFFQGRRSNAGAAPRIECLGQS